jgi:hypothetical protein
MKEITPKTSNSAGDNGSEPESDDPSDQCDFGYVLVYSRAELKKNGVGEAHPKRQSELERQFDPADHRGKA